MRSHQVRTNAALPAITPTWAPLQPSGALDVAILANAGDWVEVGLSMIGPSSGQYIYFDVAVMVGTNVVRWVSSGNASHGGLVSGPTATGWFRTNGVDNTSAGGSMLHKVASGDLENGTTLRLRLYAVNTSGSAVVISSANDTVAFYVEQRYPTTPWTVPAIPLSEYVGWGVQAAVKATDYAAVVLAANPLAYWRFKGGSSVVASETGPNKDIGFQSNNGLYAQGAYDDKNALYMQGGTVGGVLTQPLAWTQIATWEWEMVFALRPAVLGNASGTIFDRDQGPTRGFQLNTVFTGGAQVIQYIQTVGSITSFLSSGHVDLRDGLPHHLVMNQGGGQFKMYIDGVLRAGGANAQQAASTSVIGLGATFSASQNPWPISQQANGVRVDELAFYGTVSTDAQIAARYAALVADADYMTARTPTAYELAVAADNPTAAYPLNEADKNGTGLLTSTGWIDGSGYTAGVTSAAALVSGKTTDRCAVFNGSTYATVSIPVGASAFSIEMWLEPDTNGAGQFVAGRWEGTGGYSWYLARTGTGIGFCMYFAGDKSIGSSVPLTLGARNHVVGTYDGANIKIYVNGSLGGTLAQTGAATGGGTSRLGRIQINGSMYTGKMDEVRSYGTALSLSQVQAHYAAGTA